MFVFCSCAKSSVKLGGLMKGLKVKATQAVASELRCGGMSLKQCDHAESLVIEDSTIFFAGKSTVGGCSMRTLYKKKSHIVNFY